MLNLKRIKDRLRPPSPRSSEPDFPSFIDYLDKGVFRLDLQTRTWRWVNPPIVRMFGYETREAFLAVPFADHFQNRSHAEQLLTLSGARHNKINAEFPMKKKDGTALQMNVNAVLNEASAQLRWIDGTLEPVTDLSNTFETITGLIHDVERMKRINVAYERFVPQKMLKGLGKKNIGEVRLNDRTQKKMTILFSDIRSFSSLSERMTLEENFNFINSYLSWMGPCVRRNHGFIDKYIGDSIMALFDGEADDAVRCGVEMLNELKKFNKERARARLQPVEIGIGLNTGTLMMGMVGEAGHMEGTVIGDAVNAAARMEKLTKAYQTPLLISEHTYHALRSPQTFSTRFVDRVLVKGRSEPIAIYEVFDGDPIERQELKNNSKSTFESAMYHFRYHDMTQGRQMLEQLMARYPDDPVLQRYDASLGDGVRQLVSPWKQQGWYELKDELLCDIPILDDDHVILFRLIEELMEIIKQNQTEESFLKGLIAINTKAARHFQTEEDMMRQSNYPAQAHHIKLHKEFLENMESIINIKSNVREGKKDEHLHLLLRIETLFVEWLANHEIIADRHYLAYLMNLL